MPILNVKVSATKSPQLVHQISDLLLELTTRILKKDRRLTAIAIDFIDHDSWVVGGSLLSEQGKNSFYFDIKITDETNTKAEKAQYIREAFDGFARHPGQPARGELHLRAGRARDLIRLRRSDPGVPLHH